ncbi:MAG: DUF2148 domain-containing protein [Eubacteriaceae bacterium]|jgi:uncharacterized ferredoxin-like protein|nr:DUF2148 domain-containing protein [Eubacteriaceae bacterium]
MIINREEAENEALRNTAVQMMAAIRTAPKGCGMDNVTAVIVSGEDKQKLADSMMEIHEETGLDFMKRDAENAARCDLMIVVGVKDIPMGMPDCGLCGAKDCAENRKKSSRCVFNITDLGIALGSAVSVAADSRIDSRIFYSAGQGALRMGILGDDVKVAYGIGLSISTKSIFFDREPRKMMK